MYFQDKNKRENCSKSLEHTLLKKKKKKNQKKKEKKNNNKMEIKWAVVALEVGTWGRYWRRIYTHTETEII